MLVTSRRRVRRPDAHAGRRVAAPVTTGIRSPASSCTATPLAKWHFLGATSPESRSRCRHRGESPARERILAGSE